MDELILTQADHIACITEGLLRQVLPMKNPGSIRRGRAIGQVGIRSNDHGYILKLSGPVESLDRHGIHPLLRFGKGLSELAVTILPVQPLPEKHQRSQQSLTTCIRFAGNEVHLHWKGAVCRLQFAICFRNAERTYLVLHFTCNLIEIQERIGSRYSLHHHRPSHILRPGRRQIATIIGRREKGKRVSCRTALRHEKRSRVLGDGNGLILQGRIQLGKQALHADGGSYGFAWITVEYQAHIRFLGIFPGLDSRECMRIPGRQQGRFLISACRTGIVSLERNISYKTFDTG